MVGTLQELYQALGNRRMTLCRELTKKYETAFRTTIEDLIAFYKDQKPLGECVLAVSYTHLDVYKRQAVYRDHLGRGIQI